MLWASRAKSSVNETASRDPAVRIMSHFIREQACWSVPLSASAETATKRPDVKAARA